MVGWHHQFNGREFEPTLGDSEGQGSLACWSPWSCKKSDTTLLLKNNHLLLVIYSRLSPYTFLIFLQNYFLNNNTFKNIYLLDSSSFLQVKETQTTGKYMCILWKTFPSKLFPNCIFTEKEKSLEFLAAGCCTTALQSHRHWLIGPKEEPWGHSLGRQSCPWTVSWTEIGGQASLYNSQLSCSPVSVAWQRNS